MDGVITIGTSLDRKQLDRDLAKAEKDMEKFAKEGENLTKRKAKLELDTSKTENDIQKLMDKLSELDYKKVQISASKEQIASGKALGVDLTKDKEYSKLLAQETALETKGKEYYRTLDMQKTKLAQQSAELTKINQKISDNTIKQSEQAQKVTDLKQKTKGLHIYYDKAGSAISKLSKKVVKWGLALLSIRGVMGGVRQAMSTLSQYNDDLATKLNSIRLILASALEPIVNWLIQGVYTVLSYVNALLKAWFGIDLFARATALSMKKGAGSAKEMSKTMAGFDEMNTVQDNSASGGGAGKGFEAPKLGETPGWLELLQKNGKSLIPVISGIGAAFLGWKIGNILKDLGVIKGLKFSNILGLGIAIGGIVALVQDVVEFIKDPSWDKFVAILGDILIIIGGIMLLTGNWMGLLVALVGLAVKLIAENWDKIKGVLGTIGNWIYQVVITPIINFFYQLMDTIESIFNTVRSIISGVFTSLFHIIVDPFMSAFDSVKEIFDNLSKIVQNIADVFIKIFKGDIPGAFQSMKNVFKSVCDTLGSIFKAPINLIISAVNALIKGLNKLSFDIPDWIPLIGGQKWGFNLPEIPKLFTGGILNAPGKGVNYGGANIGERGAEGVIPLTNTAMMEELGRQIGKNVVINASITNSMDGRVISRQLKTIKTDDDFAFNN